MKKLILIVLFLGIGISIASAMDTVAVAGFLNQGEESDDNINEIITRSLIDLLENVPDIAVVDYDDIESSALNSGLWEKTEHEMSDIDRMGLSLGADKLIIGDYNIDNTSDTISGNFTIYDVKTGEMVVTRQFSGDAGVDIFDTVDTITETISFALMGREIVLANMVVGIQEKGVQYLAYVNGQYEGIVSKTNRLDTEILADYDVELSLRLQDGDFLKEVYRETVNVEAGDTYTVFLSEDDVLSADEAETIDDGSAAPVTQSDEDSEQATLELKLKTKRKSWSFGINTLDLFDLTAPFDNNYASLSVKTLRFATLGKPKNKVYYTFALHFDYLGGSYSVDPSVDMTGLGVGFEMGMGFNIANILDRFGKSFLKNNHFALDLVWYMFLDSNLIFSEIYPNLPLSFSGGTSIDIIAGYYFTPRFGLMLNYRNRIQTDTIDLNGFSVSKAKYSPAITFGVIYK